MPPCVGVPLTKPWFLGVANIRGNLYTVVDFAGFLGQEITPPAAMGSQARLVLFGPRAGELRVGIVVPRVLGLRNLAELAPAAPPADAPPWYGQRWIDADGGAWQEIDLARLAADPAFLQVGL
jgi:twitching motility protein PilI